MIRRALYLFLAATILLYASSSAAQEKQTSKQAVESRLKAVEKEKVSPAVEQAIHALNAANDFAFGRRAFPESDVFDAFIARCNARPAAVRSAELDNAAGVQRAA